MSALNLSEYNVISKKIITNRSLDGFSQQNPPDADFTEPISKT